VKARAAAGETLVTMLAVALTVLSAWLLDPEPGAAVLGGMLALTLSRSQLERDWRGRLEAAIALPVIGVVAALLGVLLLAVPVVGAAVYTLGLAASVLIRRFGPVWRRLGALVALPFTALLVAPVAVARTGPIAALGWLVPILVPLLAFVWVTLLQLGAGAVRIPLIADPAAAAARSSRPPGRRDARGRLPSDKMAIQLGIALVLAFAVGLLLFADHWAWIVLTVVIVLFGTRGRVDALIKGIGRLLGSIAGSALALVPLRLALPLDGWGLLPIALVLAAGIFLRRFAYVWWALCFTVVLASVQSATGGADGAAGAFRLEERVLEILVGAGIAVAVAWFVLPVGRRQPLPRGWRAWRTALTEP